MNTCIYDKTDMGREEIATRKYQVPPKLRTMLVMIDGRQPLEALLKNFAVLGMSKDNVDDLERQGFIRLVSGGPEGDEADPEESPVPRAPASARARVLARTAKRQEKLAEVERDEPAPLPAAGQPAPPGQETPPARRGFFDYFNLASDSVNFSDS
jgi:hypothetical protein